ncbi:hypothetical protein CLOBOL_01771 [Enterocloster bolteae ATCC BAA-613]|uniref:Uncharacterized protein n=1 Tax=Enterocloster bolteae (strain ATCC BAA-613 / DSM 15670 / CCUG 46953 / JCM 12243 / WAL 16351) TaxID=411902 RepID=A8RLX3_ENTBW|nr:hypothetical protein CLOBOL_01771 [Enterocloster bolteae ATCC BAA-613]
MLIFFLLIPDQIICVLMLPREKPGPADKFDICPPAPAGSYAGQHA